MNDALIKILSHIIECWLLLASLIMFVWAFRSEQNLYNFIWLTEFDRPHRWPKKLVIWIMGFSTLGGLFVIVFHGCKGVLSFLSDAPRLFVSAAIGFILSFNIHKLLISHNEQRGKDLLERTISAYQREKQTEAIFKKKNIE
jgi:hypothetical protein